jgi:hypothetical protein
MGQNSSPALGEILDRPYPLDVDSDLRIAHDRDNDALVRVGDRKAESIRVGDTRLAVIAAADHAASDEADIPRRAAKRDGDRVSGQQPADEEASPVSRLSVA